MTETIYKTCSKCNKIKPTSEFNKDNQRIDGLYPSCKDCRILDRQKNKKLIYEQKKCYRLNNKEKISIAKKKYAIANKDKINVLNAKHRSLKKRSLVSWYESEKELIKLKYKEAQKFGLHVDHIVPLQHSLVCGLHCNDNLQLLTPFDNISKSNNFII